MQNLETASMDSSANPGQPSSVNVPIPGEEVPPDSEELGDESEEVEEGEELEVDDEVIKTCMETLDETMAAVQKLGLPGGDQTMALGRLKLLHDECADRLEVADPDDAQEYLRGEVQAMLTVCLLPCPYMAIALEIALHSRVWRTLGEEPSVSVEAVRQLRSQIHTQHVRSSSTKGAFRCKYGQQPP